MYNEKIKRGPSMGPCGPPYSKQRLFDTSERIPNLPVYFELDKVFF